MLLPAAQMRAASTEYSQKFAGYSHFIQRSAFCSELTFENSMFATCTKARF